MTVLRKIAASLGTSFLVFISIVFASPASAASLDDAIAALQAGKQELSAAVAAQLLADSAVVSARANVAQLEQSVAAAQLAYEASAVTTTTVSSGITAEVYNTLGYNNAPPLPTADSLVRTTTVGNINFNWGGGEVLGSGLYEDVIVKFTGNIVVPTTGEYTFYAPGDDGIKFILNESQIINDWYDKGGGGTPSSAVRLEAGTAYPFTLWFYENGGGANVWLYWASANSGWTIIPESAFGSTTLSTEYDQALLGEWESLQEQHTDAIEAVVVAVTAQAEAVERVRVAEQALPALEQAVVDATPPPSEPEPPTTPAQPEEPAAPPVTAPEFPVVEESVPEFVSPEPPVVEPTTEEVMAQAWEEATEDDIVVPEELAAIPLIGNAVVALADVVNFVGNVGADMTPEVRAQSEKVVISAVIVGQVAQLASSAATSAAASTSRKAN